MRRSDREVTELTDILSILDKCDTMRLGLCVNDKPYIVPMNFAYEVTEKKVHIYFHCASKGRKMEMMARNDNVCFEADCSYKTLKSDMACHWSAEFESVIGEGKIIVLNDEAQKVKALDLLMKRYGFEGKPHYNSRELIAVTVLQIAVTAITGKRKVAKHKGDGTLAGENNGVVQEGGAFMALDLVGWNVVLDSSNADELSAFYERLLGWTRFPGEEFTVLANVEQKGFPTWITFQQVDDYVPPVWPATLDEQQQMEHLDFHVKDVEEAVEHALSCGAIMSEIQCEDGWRVMIDPAGHPFCLLPPPPWIEGV